MPLFKKPKPAASTPTAVVRSNNCIYLGEAFPNRGERMAAAGVEFEWLVDRAQMPNTWTDLVETVRQTTGEARERRVSASILGILMSMIANSTNQKLGQVLGQPGRATELIDGLMQGNNSIEDARVKWGAVDRGPEFFDFETIKWASMLTAPASVGARRDQEYPPPDLWPGDVNLFPLDP